MTDIWFRTMKGITSIVFVITLIFWPGISGNKLETLKKCCNLGNSYAKSGLKCSNFQTPIAGISKQDEPFCLNSIDVCCKKEHREQECKLGQEDAQLGKPCSAEEFRKDCCEACEIGIEAGVSGQTCKTELGLGLLMDSAFIACCEKSLSSLSTTKSTTVVNRELTVSTKGLTPVTSAFTKSLEKHNSTSAFPNLELLCDAPDLCPHICIQTGKSYRCDCYEGYSLMSDGISCKPNRRSGPVSQRCLENNPCDHKCTDTGVAIKCSCFEGYKLDSDKKTCKDIDECALDIDDCGENEVCVNLDGDYECQEEEARPQQVNFNDKCPEGYKFNGQLMVCDDINECEVPIVCPKPSVCINTIGSYRCENTQELPKCPPGFFFKQSIQTCDDIDECITGKDDCNKDSQICLNTKGNYTCIDKASKKTCPPGFKKNLYTQQCEDINECDENIQLCSESEECINELGGHSCKPKLRPQPTTIAHVPTTPNKPTSSTVQTTTTRQPQTSTTTQRAIVKPLYIPTPGVSTTNIPIFPPFIPAIQRVTCTTGYKYSSQINACIDIDECREINHICDSNQDCYNTAGSYVCSCKIGFSKDHQTGACVDINECQIGKHDCGEAQRCDNTIGSYVCARTTGCGTGYTLNSATGLCEDDDECLLGLHNCHDLGPKFQCRNTLGSYRCERIKCIGDCLLKKVSSTTNLIPTQHNPIISGQLKKCLPGYRMNQKGECEDIDECESNPCKRGEKCLNLNGRYQCIPLIYCKSGYELNDAGSACEDINECTRGTHKCKNSQICKNGPGYYICQCPPGHKLNADNECEDINECDFYRDRICSRNSQCINTVGSYECKCKDGFRANGHACDDIDECSEVSGLCHQNCVNLWGGYRCSCNRGFTLSIDNRTCTDINECEKFRDKQLCVGTCQNTPGSYTCRCPEGYRLGSDGRTCQDVDECLGSICRNADDICINTRGSYKCHTILCPPNYIKDPEHKSRCKRASNVCDIRDTQCIRMPGQYSYHFITFVSNLPIPDEGKIDFFQMKGPSWISSSANFNMDIVNVRCPPHIKQADSNHFRMKRDLHKVIVSLVRSIEGPQEIELQLQMELYVSGVFQGKVISTVFIYVSEFEF